jgi:hypothetical protein
MRQTLCKYGAFLAVVVIFVTTSILSIKQIERTCNDLKWLQVVREHLVTDWKATVTDGIEADDAMGIAQCTEHDGDSMICSIDKDMLMIPGHHYNFVKQEFRMVSPLEGLRNFYFQLIMGDKTDNIPGYDGKMRTKVPQFLEGAVSYLDQCMTEWEMFDHVKNMWNDDTMFMTAAQCLWIQRKPNDKWTPPDAPTEEELDGGAT